MSGISVFEIKLSTDYLFKIIRASIRGPNNFQLSLINVVNCRQPLWHDYVVNDVDEFWICEDRW